MSNRLIKGSSRSREDKLVLRNKIAPRSSSRASPRTVSVEPRDSTSPPLRGMQTQNSIRAGQSQGIQSTSRARSLDPIAKRVEDRIGASRAKAALQESAIIPEVTEMSSQNLDITGGSAPRASYQTPGPHSSRSQRMPKPGEKNSPTFNPD